MKSTSKSALALALLVLWMLVGCGRDDHAASSSERIGSSSAADTVLDTTGSSSGGSTAFGIDTGAPSLGAVITVPAADTLLKTVFFPTVSCFFCSTSADLNARLEVYAWNGTMTTGSAIYESGPIASVGGVLPTIDTGGVNLTAGSQYAVFLTSVVDASNGALAVAQSSGTIPGSALILTSAAKAAWGTTAWFVSAPSAFKFKMTFTTAISTTTTVTSSQPSSVVGEPITLTAAVVATTGTATGTVDFFDGATSLGTGTLDGLGHATLQTNAVTLGSHTITAHYDGAGSFVASTSIGITQTVAQASTTTTISSGSNPSLIGGSVTFTAMVSAASPSTGVPAGTVSFHEGATVLGTGTLSSGTATFTTTTLSIGPHDVVADYVATPDCAASSSAAVAQVVDGEGAMVTLISAPSPSTYGTAVVFIAVVTGSADIPTGTVTFTDGSTALGDATLATGVGTLSVPNLASGTHVVTAVYSGDAIYDPGNGSLSHVVGKAATTTTVASAINPAEVGDAVSFTATVSSPAAGFTGEVELFDGTTSIGKAMLSGGTAKVTTSTLVVAAHAVTAMYKGDANFAPSTSSALTETVNAKAAPATPPSTNDGGIDSDAGATDATSDAVDEGGGGGCSTSGRGTAGGHAELLFALGAVAIAIGRKRRRPRSASL
jgi:hypothetical protein